MKNQKIELVCPKCGLSHVKPIEHEPIDEERAFKCTNCGEEFVITVSFEANQVVIHYNALSSTEAAASACFLPVG